MLKHLSNKLDDQIRLFLQANFPMERQHISIIDIIELIDIARLHILDELIPEPIEIMNEKNKTIVLAGSYKKYRADSKQKYNQLWTDIKATIYDMSETNFLREIILKHSTKNSSPIMVKHFVSVIICPMLDLFQVIGPENVLKYIGTNNDPFDWLKNRILNTQISTHPTDILVAQKLIPKYAGKR